MRTLLGKTLDRGPHEKAVFLLARSAQVYTKRIVSEVRQKMLSVPCNTKLNLDFCFLLAEH